MQKFTRFLGGPNGPKICGRRTKTDFKDRADDRLSCNKFKPLWKQTIVVLDPPMTRQDKAFLKTSSFRAADKKYIQIKEKDKRWDMTGPFQRPAALKLQKIKSEFSFSITERVGGTRQQTARQPTSLYGLKAFFSRCTVTSILWNWIEVSENNAKNILILVIYDMAIAFMLLLQLL